MGTSDNSFFILILILGIVLTLTIYILLCRIPAKMAKNKGRSFNGWFSFLTNPLLGIIIVACLSETEQKRLQRLVEEEEIRQKIAKGDINSNNISNYKSIHDIYNKASSSVIDKYKE